jgi:hypothetical protein
VYASQPRSLSNHATLDLGRWLAFAEAGLPPASSHRRFRYVDSLLHTILLLQASPGALSAETPPAKGDRKFPTRSALTRLERAIEAQREQLLQAHGVLTCLYEVLLYAEGDDAINYAQAAHAAARLINKSVEDLDSLRIRPLIDEIVFKSGVRVEDSARNYWG